MNWPVSAQTAQPTRPRFPCARPSQVRTELDLLSSEAPKACRRWSPRTRFLTGCGIAHQQPGLSDELSPLLLRRSSSTMRSDVRQAGVLPLFRPATRRDDGRHKAVEEAPE